MTDTTDIARRVSMTANGDTYEIWLDANRYHYRTDGFAVLMLEGMNHSYPRRVQSAAIKAALKAIVELHGKLEAERQRADEGAKEITYWCNLNARKNERMGELEAAEKERDEITTGILELIPDCRYMDPPDGGSVTPLEQLSRMVTELRAAPQKPNVLLGHIKISEVVAAVSLDQNRKWNGRVGYMAGWNACIDAAIAAGGIVKDGESASIACWSCKKTMTLAQHSSNDGLCPHCNVEIDLEE